MSDLQKNYMITGSPQYHAFWTTNKIMWMVSLTLLPAAIWGVKTFGINALWVLIVSILSAVATEALAGLVSRKQTIGDGSAFLTGLLVGMNMPPAVPLWIAALASIFAILVVKITFGGLGANWMNPALAGRIFVAFSFSKAMGTWTLPLNGSVDMVTGPTPLGAVKSALMEGVASDISGPLELIRESFGIGLTYNDLLFGNIAGTIGEVSGVILIAGGLVLLFTKIINWEIPVIYIGSFALFVWIFGGLRYKPEDALFIDYLFKGDILFHLFTGGLMLGAWFMATDMVTTPITFKGRVLFAIGCGFLTYIIRFFGSLPEGVSLAIVFMNMLVPLIDRYSKTNRFGMDPVKNEIALQGAIK